MSWLKNPYLKFIIDDLHDDLTGPAALADSDFICKQDMNIPWNQNNIYFNMPQVNIEGQFNITPYKDSSNPCFILY